MIARVLGILVTALDDLEIDYVTIRHCPEKRHATVSFRTNEGAGQVATALGVTLRAYEGDGRAWQMADVTFDGVGLTIMGPHRPIWPRLEVVS